MNTEQTEPKGKWRLLEPDEPRQIGDELYMAQWSRSVWTPWASDLNKPIDHLLARRRMTPAEEHAEELLEALLELLSLDEFDETVSGASSIRTAIMDKARAARAKTEGKSSE